jgi:hypothetical protein
MYIVMIVLDKLSLLLIHMLYIMQVLSLSLPRIVVLGNQGSLRVLPRRGNQAAQIHLLAYYNPR